MQGTMAAFSSKIRRELSLEPSDPFSDNDDDIYPFAKIELATVDPNGKNADVIYPTAYSEKINTQRDYPDLDVIYYNFNESNKPYSPFGKELPKESGSLFAKYEALKVQPTPELPHIKQKETFKPVKKSIFTILLFGAFAIVLHYGFTYVGLGLTESSKTALMSYLLSLSEKLSARDLYLRRE
jgi:hypothetical protein